MDHFAVMGSFDVVGVVSASFDNSWKCAVPASRIKVVEHFLESGVQGLSLVFRGKSPPAW